MNLTHYQLIDDILYWSPKFFAAKIGEVPLCLIGETESYFLSDQNYSPLVTHVNACNSATDISEKYSDFQKKASIFYFAQQLEKQGLLVKGEAARKKVAQQYIFPDFSLPVAKFDLGSSLRVNLLSQMDNPDQWNLWVQKLKIPEPLTIVITDDYLDSRLEEINQIHLETKGSWLLIKITGEQPLIGPYFSPAQEKTPCWQCLAAPLLRNQPFRGWLRNREKQNPKKQNQGQGSRISIPVFYDKEKGGKLLNRIFPLLQEFVAQQNNYEEPGLHNSVPTRPLC